MLCVCVWLWIENPTLLDYYIIYTNTSTLSFELLIAWITFLLPCHPTPAVISYDFFFSYLFLSIHLYFGLARMRVCVCLCEWKRALIILCTHKMYTITSMEHVNGFRVVLSFSMCLRCVCVCVCTISSACPVLWVELKCEPKSKHISRVKNRTSMRSNWTNKAKWAKPKKTKFQMNCKFLECWAETSNRGEYSRFYNATILPMFKGIARVLFTMQKQISVAYSANCFFRQF